LRCACDGLRGPRAQGIQAVAYAFADPVIRGNQIKAPGGAIRSGGKWYRLSYVCETTPDGLEVKSFAYQLGTEVPRSEWDEHYLVPR
jgi:hypothetical protein